MFIIIQDGMIWKERFTSLDEAKAVLQQYATPTAIHEGHEYYIIEATKVLKASIPTPQIEWV